MTHLLRCETTSGDARPVVSLRVLNGLTFDRFVADVLLINRVTAAYDVREARVDEVPDVIVFGPYGAQIPPPGPYVRVGYICENYRWDGPATEFAFTVSEQSRVGVTTARIQWHGLDPQKLIKPADLDVDRIFAGKDRFCNFLYSNPVPYREQIFRRLSRYKPVDAPGSSMRNMGSIDDGAPPGQSRWESKRQFLARYKFTLALENEIFPGYQTEKLYDAMLANSLPIYLGDANLSRLFNPNSMIARNGAESSWWMSRLRDFAQASWHECQGPRRWSLANRIRRRARLLARDVHHKWLVSKLIDSIVDEVVELDRDPAKYVAKLREPWLRDNAVDEASYSTAVWEAIFARACLQRTSAPA